MHACRKTRPRGSPPGVLRARAACLTLCALIVAGSGRLVAAQSSAQNSSSSAPSSTAPASSRPQRSADSQINKDAEAEAALEKALADSGNDSAAMVRNLTNYLKKYPDSPRKAGVYRALVEACQQIQDAACAVEYAERLIAIHPDDADMML